MRSTGRRASAGHSWPRGRPHTRSLSKGMPVLSARRRAHLEGEVTKLRMWGVDPHLGAERQLLSTPKQTFLHREESVHLRHRSSRSRRRPTSRVLKKFPCVIAQHHESARTPNAGVVSPASRGQDHFSSATRQPANCKRRGTRRSLSLLPAGLLLEAFDSC
jgi:hypothetical protein